MLIRLIRPQLADVAMAVAAPFMSAVAIASPGRDSALDRIAVERILLRLTRESFVRWSAGEHGRGLTGTERNLDPAVIPPNPESSVHRHFPMRVRERAKVARSPTKGWTDTRPPN